MGYSRRNENLEIVASIQNADKAIAAMTLGQVCSSGMVMLDVACLCCKRKGRYRVTRLIDQHGAGKGLPAVKELLAADCARFRHPSHYDRCGAYFPRLVSQKQNT